MRRPLLLAALILSACTPEAPATQAAIVPGYGDHLLDDGAVLTFEKGRFVLPIEEEKQLVRMLPQVRASLASLPPGERRLCVAGHTDQVGDDETYNKQLSLRRAQAVAERMIDFGIPIADLVVRGYGSSKPFIEGPRVNPHNRVVIVARGNRCRD